MQSVSRLRPRQRSPFRRAEKPAGRMPFTSKFDESGLTLPECFDDNKPRKTYGLVVFVTNFFTPLPMTMPRVFAPAGRP